MPTIRMRAPLSARPGVLAERLRRLVDDAARHRRVDLAGQLDKAGRDVEFARLPGQVERIDRDAVAAEPGPGIERHKAERLGLGRVDHLPDVDAHRLEHDLQLVDERDVDRAEDVLGELDRLGGLERRDRHGARDDCVVERAARRSAVRPVAADHLRDGAGAKSALPGSSRSGE